MLCNPKPALLLPMFVLNFRLDGGWVAEKEASYAFNGWRGRHVASDRGVDPCSPRPTMPPWEAVNAVSCFVDFFLFVSMYVLRSQPHHTQPVRPEQLLSLCMRNGVISPEWCVFLSPTWLLQGHCNSHCCLHSCTFLC